MKNETSMSVGLSICGAGAVLDLELELVSGLEPVVEVTAS